MGSAHIPRMFSPPHSWVKHRYTDAWQARMYTAKGFYGPAATTDTSPGAPATPGTPRCEIAPCPTLFAYPAEAAGYRPCPRHRYAFRSDRCPPRTHRRGRARPTGVRTASPKWGSLRPHGNRRKRMHRPVGNRRPRIRQQGAGRRSEMHRGKGTAMLAACPRLGISESAFKARPQLGASEAELAAHQPPRPSRGPRNTD